MLYVILGQTNKKILLNYSGFNFEKGKMSLKDLTYKKELFFFSFYVSIILNVVCFIKIISMKQHCKHFSVNCKIFNLVVLRVFSISDEIHIAIFKKELFIIYYLG